MKLRFDVDPAACARAGIKHPAAPAVIDINPGQMKVDVRNLIADRLIGNDVCQLWNSEQGTNKSVDANGNPVRLVAEAPTFEALMKALRKDEQVVAARQSCHRAIALARANSTVELEPALPSAPVAPAETLKAPVSPVVPSQAAVAKSTASAEKKRRRGKRVPTKATKRKKAS